MPILNTSLRDSLCTYLKTEHLEAGCTLGETNSFGSHFFLGRVLLSNAHIFPNTQTLRTLLPNLMLEDMALFRPVDPTIADVSLAILHNAPNNRLGFISEDYWPTLTTYFILNPNKQNESDNWFTEVDLTSTHDATPLTFACDQVNMPHGLSGAAVFKACYFKNSDSYWKIAPIGIVYARSITDTQSFLLAVNLDQELRIVLDLMLQQQTEQHEEKLNQNRIDIGEIEQPYESLFSEQKTDYQSGQLGVKYHAHPNIEPLLTDQFRKILSLEQSILLESSWQKKQGQFRRFQGLNCEILEKDFTCLLIQLIALAKEDQLWVHDLQDITETYFRMDVEHRTQNSSLCFEDNTNQKASGSSSQFLHIKIDRSIEYISINLFFNAARVCAYYRFPVHILQGAYRDNPNRLNDFSRNGNIFMHANGEWDPAQIKKVSPSYSNPTLRVIETCVMHHQNTMPANASRR